MGLEVEGWEIEEPPLGEGGNAHVYRARRATDLEPLALKVQDSRRGERYDRFRDEVAFLDARRSYPGILPLIDAYAPPSLAAGARGWLAMPIAIPVGRALGVEPSLDRVLAAVAAFARTLSALADEGAFHRDIKPQNLFRLDAEWVLGDFGLVAYPDKEPRTEALRKLGSYYYIAPEMIYNAGASDPAPADVYSLGKTLWVLATGQPPFEGPIHRDEETLTVGFHRPDARSLQLDRLLHRMTARVPDARPLMVEIVDELQALIGRSSEPTTEGPDIERAGRRAAAHVDMVRQRSARLETTRELVARARSVIQEGLSPVVGPLTEFLGQLSWNSTTLSGVPLFAAPGGSEPVADAGWVIYAPGDTTEGVIVYVSVLSYDHDHVRLGAAIAVGRYSTPEDLGTNRGPSIVWSDVVEEALGSASEERAARSLAEGLTAAMPRAVETYAEMMDAGGPSPVEVGGPAMSVYVPENPSGLFNDAGGGRTVWAHLAVAATSNEPLRRCHIRLVRVERAENQAWVVDTRFAAPVRLKWAFAGLEHPEAEYRDIYPGESPLFDIAFTLERQPGRAYLASLDVDPIGLPRELAPGAYRMTARAIAEARDPVDCSFVLLVPDQWRELTISALAPTAPERA